MSKFSKVLALALAATMVVSSSVVAFAGDNDGGSTGTGSSEGHVEKKATNVVLPTIPQNTTPFAYIMDPEGLIVETAGAKYSDTAVFPASNDTRVYFNNGQNEGGKTVYANSSLVQTVENKSSYDIALTVKAEVVDAAATDIPLVAQSALTDAEAASLYLGLVVGTGDDKFTKEITSAAAAEKTVTIAGSPNNFKIAVNEAGDDYEYRALTLDEYKAIDGNEDATAIPWNSDVFSLEGEVTEDLAITDATTAPKISVTWSWVDPNATPEVTEATISSGATAVQSGSADATDGVTHTAALVKGTDTTVAISLPSGESIKKVYVAGSVSGLANNTENADRAAISGGNVVIKGDSDWANAGTGTKYVKVLVGDSTETTATFIIKVSISES